MEHLPKFGISRADMLKRVTPGNPEKEYLLMFVSGGYAPQTEFTDRALHVLAPADIWPAKG